MDLKANRRDAKAAEISQRSFLLILCFSALFALLILKLLLFRHDSRLVGAPFMAPCATCYVAVKGAMNGAPTKSFGLRAPAHTVTLRLFELPP